MKFQNAKWIRPPKNYLITEDRIEIVTEPHTDLWQNTYYHFCNDNAPVLQIDTDEKFFSFVVKTDFSESKHRFDQCGIVLYLDSTNWLKASVEFENSDFQNLGAVVTNNGYSDWSTTEIPSDLTSSPSEARGFLLLTLLFSFRGFTVLTPFGVHFLR